MNSESMVLIRGLANFYLIFLPIVNCIEKTKIRGRESIYRFGEVIWQDDFF